FRVTGRRTNRWTQAAAAFFTTSSSPTQQIKRSNSRLVVTLVDPEFGPPAGLWPGSPKHSSWPRTAGPAAPLFQFVSPIPFELVQPLCVRESDFVEASRCWSRRAPFHHRGAISHIR